MCRAHFMCERRDEMKASADETQERRLLTVQMEWKWLFFFSLFFFFFLVCLTSVLMRGDTAERMIRSSSSLSLSPVSYPRLSHGNYNQTWEIKNVVSFLTPNADSAPHNSLKVQYPWPLAAIRQIQRYWSQKSPKDTGGRSGSLQRLHHIINQWLSFNWTCPKCGAVANHWTGTGFKAISRIEKKKLLV